MTETNDFWRDRADQLQAQVIEERHANARLIAEKAQLVRTLVAAMAAMQSVMRTLRQMQRWLEADSGNSRAADKFLQLIEHTEELLRPVATGHTKPAVRSDYPF